MRTDDGHDADDESGDDDIDPDSDATHDDESLDGNDDDDDDAPPPTQGGQQLGAGAIHVSASQTDVERTPVEEVLVSEPSVASEPIGDWCTVRSSPQWQRGLGRRTMLVSR